LRDPAQMNQIRSNIARIARPRAAFTVVDRALELI
jgi:hypothetical protein